MKKLVSNFRNLPFATKFIIIYTVALSLVVSIITYEQINTSLSVLQEDKTHSLELLTEQVALNFSESYDAMSEGIYTKLRALELQSLMNSYLSQNDGNIASIQYALTQMITQNTGYNFVMLELRDGTRVYTKKPARTSTTEYQNLVTYCQNELESCQFGRYKDMLWHRSADENMYILANVYSTTPLQWVGKVIIHLTEPGFSLSEAYKDTGFLFFTSDGSFLTSAGREIGANERHALLSAAEDRSGSGSADEDYFISKSSLNGWITVGYNTKEQYRQMGDKIISVGILYGVLGLFAGLVVMLMLLRGFRKKMLDIEKSMDRVSDGDLNVSIQVPDHDDISRMALNFNRMTGQIQKLLDTVKEKERLKNDAEMQILEYKYRSLETQIRPHFIYNAFDVINAMSKIKGETEIVEVVQRISHYFRNITINTNQQFITTEREFDALEDYTEIYKFIHAGTLKVTFSMQDAARGAMIPTMIVQPVVENALKHGLRAQNETSEVIVHAYITGEMLNLTVKDTGFGLTTEQEERLQSGDDVSGLNHSGIGVGNVRKRLELIYGDNSSFTISNRPEGGVVVRIAVPLSYSEPIMHFEDDWDFNL